MLSASTDRGSTTFRSAGLRFLPGPDTLEHAWDPETVCAILDDGGELAAPLAAALSAIGWRAVVITLDLSAPPSWARTFEQSAGSNRLAAFIDIHRAEEDEAGDPLASGLEEARVKASFLLACQLQPLLTADGLSRACYAVVTRVDGELGLSAAPKSRGIVTAGVAALAKTLRHEWPSVCCRAIDVDPAMDPATAARLVAAELLDPDMTLVEVGHGLGGRCTVAAIDTVRRE